MKMTVEEIIKKSSVEDMAKIIGSVIAMHIDGITAEEATKMEHKETLKVLQSEMEVDYQQTNADRIRSMSDDELADYIFGVSIHEKPCVLCSDDCDFCELSDEECKRKTLKWLHSESEE